uniref:Uncharacterized protein LOC114347768 n=1 Tax=Diabrotica virgifera virgifera TaxID=50390 RepID=A0A6P7GXQ7_DIAVI
MPADCKQCNLEIKSQDKHIYCDCCRTTFHLTEECSGMSASEMRAVVLQKRTLMFLCLECRDAFKSAPMVVRKMSELQDEVNSLKRELQELKSSPVSSNIELILSEAHERSIRANNLMVYDVPESSAIDFQDKIRHDTQIVHQIFEKVGHQTKVPDIVKVLRVGQKGRNNKPRPIKIICNNSETVKHIFRSKRRLESFKISYDSTKLQQNAFKSAKEELQRRISNGEPDLQIKYINGIP